MKFARVLFAIAGVYGLLVLLPMYFVFDVIGQQMPPAITHPEFYYGFVSVAIAWQVGFLVIASDPARYRPIMIPSVMEKSLHVIGVVALYLQQRAGMRILVSAVGDAVLGVLFVAAFFLTRRHPQRS